jgi:hypothetical protein
MDSGGPIDFSNSKTLEKYSSAFTLSDMEIFIFPELFYPLVLANIMSPVIWKWRDDPWFKDLEKKNFNYKVNRIKQFIIQNFVFNLDLSTWGLTTKTREIERFSDFFDMDLLRQSNALFGYEGDSYYFDIGIRKHFGLDKFDSEIIPYWKTETVEAMNAFIHKESFSTGAGECVSLSALYAASMFILGRIPLEKIFLIATPLHSQNFIMEKEGIITNNRRIVTKNMWFNGTTLSEKARRALENEKVTIVSHISGHIHTIYNDATIEKQAYNEFSTKLREFLITDLTINVFVNFLRFKSKYKCHFQYRCEQSGNRRYITLEKMFEYEHTSKFSASPETRNLLLEEIESDDFHMSPIQGKILLNEAENILLKLQGKNIPGIEKEFMRFSDILSGNLIHEMFADISDFIHTEPKLPDNNKNYTEARVPNISVTYSRDKIMDAISNLAGKSEMCSLAMYVYRRMDHIDWLPFIKAAIERNPVCFTDLCGKNPDDVYLILKSFPDDSIYDGNRLALPDEVWNFRRGDGIEKAILLADFIMNKDNSSFVSINIENSRVFLSNEGNTWTFSSGKSFHKSIAISNRSYIIK